MSLAKQKAANSYIRSIGLVVDYHIPAGVANIVLGHNIHHESCLRDTTKYLRSEGVKIDDDQIVSLIDVVRASA